MAKVRLTKEQLEFLDKNPSAVICLETGVAYPNAHRASKEMKLSYTAINSYVRGSRTTPIAGYTFDYLERLKGRRF